MARQDFWDTEDTGRRRAELPARWRINKKYRRKGNSHEPCGNT